jgi:hypothetical protein
MSSASISSRTRSIRAPILLLSFATTLSFAQHPMGQPATSKASDKPKSASADSHSPDSQNVLRQMNSALEELAARVSPAVVQIQTTGYGPLTEGDSDRGRTALILRQHAVGSGVIVDSDQHSGRQAPAV